MADAPDRDLDSKLDEAMEWLLKLEPAPRDAALRAAFKAWLAADERHVRAWERINRAWTYVGEHPPVHAERWAREAPARRSAGPGRRAVAPDGEAAGGAIGRRRLARRGVAAGLVLAALAACVLLLIAPSLLLRLEADYVTAVGESRQLELADGTLVHLGPSSAIAMDWTADRRAVALLAGQAFLAVTPDKSRPFVLDADGVEVAVVGTAFDVELGSTGVAVGVQEGKVKVRYEAGDAPLDVLLSPGERLDIDRATGEAARRQIPAGEIAGWRDGRLFVDGASIAEVVEQLRRYQRGWIVITDAHLGGQPVTGLYDLRNPGRALRALVEPYGGVVHEVTPLLHVVSAR